MREIALFVEDYAHQQVIGALIQRMAKEYGIAVDSTGVPQLVGTAG